MANAPCKGCPDRTVEPNCHMTCEKYIAFQQECRAMADSRLEDREYRGYRANIRKRVNKAQRAMKRCSQYRNRMN